MDKIYAQGDVLLVPVEAVAFKPETCVSKEGEPAILQHGEHTNHVHGIYGGNVAMFRDDGLARPAPNGQYLGHLVVGEGGAKLEHGTGPGKNDGDHASIDLPKGTFAVFGQQEIEEGETVRAVSD